MHTTCIYKFKSGTHAETIGEPEMMIKIGDFSLHCFNRLDSVSCIIIRNRGNIFEIPQIRKIILK